ncbi:cupin domain-containing protein [Leptospira wolffii]|uniref:cupin domain-containing protein n=1 Tax=Leptospira wolffii TaxID=409998 RepID=UPI0002FEA215|nr:cupin domain-containing protein [Leptospira wolffii]EPG66703.1 PF05899 family protein [Leptospira wolffii serovar Khorat str. Khorat-H2]
MKDKNEKEYPIVYADANDQTGWRDYPIDRVISGEPKSKVKILRLEGARTKVMRLALVSSEPSKFYYKFVYDESFQLCSGHIVLSFDSGEVVEMFPGDVLSVPAGRESVFEIKKSSMKFVVVTGYP